MTHIHLRKRDFTRWLKRHEHEYVGKPTLPYSCPLATYIDDIAHGCEPDVSTKTYTYLTTPNDIGPNTRTMADAIHDGTEFMHTTRLPKWAQDFVAVLDDDARKRARANPKWRVESVDGAYALTILEKATQRPATP